MFDEKKILKKCLLNDRKAQKQLYDHYAPVLLGICMRYTQNRAEAEDVLQEGFVRIFCKLKTFEGRSSLGSWMHRIIVNIAITDYHRNLKHRHQKNIDEMAEVQSYDEYPGKSDFTGEELLKVIRGLSPGYRTVFNLYAVEGYRHREIAEMLGIDVNTSKSQYSRAKKIIQTRLKQMEKVSLNTNE